jgi:hypothetical protein
MACYPLKLNFVKFRDCYEKGNHKVTQSSISIFLIASAFVSIESKYRSRVTPCESFNPFYVVQVKKTDLQIIGSSFKDIQGSIACAQN